MAGSFSGRPGPASGSFDQDIVAAVCRHMNDDHADDSLLICRALGGQPSAVAATAVHVDAESMHFTATVGDQPTWVRVSFEVPVSQRPEIRAAVVQLYERACAVAGLAPRDERH